MRWVKCRQEKAKRETKIETLRDYGKMKYQGPSAESWHESIEGTLYSETGVMEEKIDERMSVEKRDSRWSILMPSNFPNELEGNFVVRSITK